MMRRTGWSMLILLLSAACHKNPGPVARPLPPPPPGVASTIPKTPAPPQPVAEPTLVPPEPVRDDAIKSASLDDLNKSSPLKPVFFEYDSSDLSAEAVAALNENAGVLKRFSTWAVTVEGHCDERGSAESSSLGRAPRGGRAHVSRFAWDRSRPAAHGQLRQGIPLRPGPRRGRILEEPPRAFRHHGKMIMKQRVRATMLLLVGVSLAAPARAADKETLQMMADIRMLQEQTQQLQNLIGAVGEALKTVSGRLDQQTEVNRKAFADQKSTIDTLAADLRVVRERVDDSNVRIGSVSQEVEALRQSIELLNVPPPSAAAAEPAPPAPGVPGVPPSPSPAAPPLAPRSAAVGMSPTRLFDEAKAMYWAGQAYFAAMGFDSYIKTFPKSEQADVRNSDRERLSAGWRQ